MKLNKIILVLSCLISTSVLAQNNKIPIKTEQTNSIKSGAIQKVADKEFTSEQITELNSLLLNSNYTEFYEYIKKTSVAPNKYISYLESKKFEGHIPLYWLMADYYSKQTGKEEETHFWYDVAIIMTYQDSHLCYDATVKYATDKLSKSFPNPVNVIRNSPQYNHIVMPKVAFFISNIKKRINPKWVCVFGDEPVRSNNYILRPVNEWATIRQEIFNKFTKDYPQ